MLAITLPQGGSGGHPASLEHLCVWGPHQELRSKRAGGTSTPHPPPPASWSTSPSRGSARGSLLPTPQGFCRGPRPRWPQGLWEMCLRAARLDGPGRQAQRCWRMGLGQPPANLTELTQALQDERQESCRPGWTDSWPPRHVTQRGQAEKVIFKILSQCDIL